VTTYSPNLADPNWRLKEVELTSRVERAARSTGFERLGCLLAAMSLAAKWEMRGYLDDECNRILRKDSE